MLILLLSAFATGLAGSAHCVSMCGGISASLGLNSAKKRFLFTYHAGRLLSYICLGIIFGVLLPLIGIAPQQATFAAPLRIFTALIMIIIGIQIATGKNFARYLEKYGFFLWQPIARFARSLLPLRSHSEAFILGIFWGLLPCGLIYSALGLAFGAANPTVAAAIMLAFGIGTLPAMLTVTVFTGTLLRSLLQHTSRLILGSFVILLGIWTLYPFI